MLFFVQAVIDVTARAILQRESERRLHFATGRFKRHIGGVGVVLQDLNGRHRGRDKVCRVTAKFRRGGSLEIEEKRSSFVAAIAAAAKRLRRSLAPRIGGKVTRSAVRHDRGSYRRPWSLL